MPNPEDFMQVAGHVDGRIAYRDAGEGAAVVFVHGTPTSSFEYVELIRQLSNNYRCVAIDHLGFGNSDKPKDALYSIEAHTNRLRWLLTALNIDSYHLVVHDFGGVIGLPLALDRNSGVRSITIMNSWAWPLIETEPQLKSQLWILRSWLMNWLYLNANFSPRVLLKMAWGKHRPLTKQKHRAYQSPFKSRDERYGLLAFKDILLNLQEPCWNLHNELKRLTQLPVLLAWGMKDSFISTRNLDRWLSIFPQAEIAKLDNVGHFVADEAHDLVAPIFQKFWKHHSSS